MSRRATASHGLALAAVLFVVACSLPLARPDSPDPNVMTAAMSADEVRAEVARVMRETPLPPGAAWTPVFVDQSAWYGPYGGGSMIEFQALCAWLREAADATKMKDPERLAAADAVLAEIPSWRTFSDPALMDTGSRAFVVSLVDDARKREFAAVGRYLAANCGP
jgi:hypothetical protein